MIRIMRAAVAALAFAFLTPTHSFAQASSAFVVAPCVTSTGGNTAKGAVPYCSPVTSSNPMPVSGTFSATLGGFQPTAQGTPISATTAGVAGSLPAGTSGVAQDVGSFPAYCQFGGSATGITNGHYLSGAGAQWAYLVPTGATQLTCEGVGGTTQINLYGGSGLGVDTGAGGGGSFTWPGTAGNAQQGVNPGTGTMPYVNAVNKAGPYISAGASTGQYGVSISSVTTLTVPSGTLAAEICVEGGTARYTDDGATPSASVGIPVPAATGVPICWQVAGPALLSAFKIIGASATIDVSYYK